LTRIKIVIGENVDQLRDPSEEAALGFVAGLREAGREVYRDFSLSLMGESIASVFESSDQCFHLFALLYRGASR
jgi:hypothetical protein